MELYGALMGQWGFNQQKFSNEWELPFSTLLHSYDLQMAHLVLMIYLLKQYFLFLHIYGIINYQVVD